MKQNVSAKHAFLVIAIVLVLAAIAIYSWVGNSSDESMEQGPIPNSQDSSEIILDASPPPVSPPAKSTTTTKPTDILKQDQEYQAAVAKYQYRFQIVDCHGSPGVLTMKEGSPFMIENKSAASHVFAVGTKKYTIKPYWFVVATAPSAGTYFITCDGGGAARLDSQK